jgi:integrase
VARRWPLFQGVKDRPLTTAAAMSLLQELRPGVTAHGFRLTFRDWARKHPREVIEAATAHRLKDKSEAAYQRGGLLTRRAKLMKNRDRFFVAPPHSRAAPCFMKLRD